MKQSYVNIEKNRRFSQSELWQLQRQYFEEQGIKAWQEAAVPHYITSNPFIAKTYAEIVFGFFRDTTALQKAGTEKIYLIELGGGSGRFAYHFLKHLDQLCTQATFKTPSFCYVLTDLAQKNLEFWQQHTHLQPFIEKGILDFACLDAENDFVIELVHAKVLLKQQSLLHPIILIGNYFFDSINQDLFYVKDHQLHEVKVSLDLPDDMMEKSPAEKLNALDISYSTSTLGAPFYPETGFNAIIDYYRDVFEETYILFPHVALRCLERFRQLSNAGFILLSADKGSHRIKELENQPQPSVVRHGSFSLQVNYHAIMSFYDRSGAQSIFTTHHHQSLNVGCIMAIKDAALYKETKFACDRFIEKFGPDDFFNLKKHFEQHIDSMELCQVQSYIRLSGYDARFFKQCIFRLLYLLSDISQREKEDMLLLIRQVWDGYYPIGEYQDLAFDLGMLLYRMDLYEEAIYFYESSFIYYEATAPVYYNLAACYFQLGKDEQALRYLTQTLALEPAHSGALELMAQFAKINV